MLKGQHYAACQRVPGYKGWLRNKCKALCWTLQVCETSVVHGASMQHFMWQQDVNGVAHFVQDCFDLLDAPV